MESLYICIDESGTLSQTEEYFVFAGYCLTSDEKYLGKSRKLQEEKENFNALEMKGTSVSVNTRNQILAIMNNQHPFAIVIKNQNIPTNIFEYHQGVALYKDELLSLIITKVLASFDLTRFNKITIIIDEQNLASNTSHNLYHKVYRRLFTGFFEQEKYIEPLADNYCKLTIKYVNSIKYPLVQAADILANSIYKSLTQNIDYRHLLKIFKSL